VLCKGSKLTAQILICTCPGLQKLRLAWNSQDALYQLLSRGAYAFRQETTIFNMQSIFLMMHDVLFAHDRVSWAQ